MRDGIHRIAASTLTKRVILDRQLGISKRKESVESSCAGVGSADSALHALIALDYPRSDDPEWYPTRRAGGGGEAGDTLRG